MMNANSRTLSNARDLHEDQPEEERSYTQRAQGLGEELLNHTIVQLNPSPPATQNPSQPARLNHSQPATLNPRTGNNLSEAMGLLVSFKSKTEVIVKDLMTELKSVQSELIGSNDENEKLRAENENIRLTNENMRLTIEGLQEVINARDSIIQELTARIDNASQAISARRIPNS